MNFVGVCVSPLGRELRIRRRERVELTILDACWSMHGDMWGISEVARLKSTLHFLDLGFGPRFWKEKGDYWALMPLSPYYS